MARSPEAATAAIASPVPAPQSFSANAKLIAIVGAGFSGVATAIWLLRARKSSSQRLEIALIDPHADLGAGAAYAARDYPYPLNVAAGQMSLDTANPTDFLDFARAQGIHAAAGDYLPRQVYGEYLRARLSEAETAAAANTTLTHLRAQALRLARGNDGRWDLWLDDGSALHPHEIVLALGNPPPACLPELADIASTSRYVGGPWDLGAPVHQDIESVLLVGSGLTMVDAALRLAAIRPRVRRIHVLSRHGWLPEAQSSHPLPLVSPDVAGALAAARGSTRKLLRAFRELAHEVVAKGGDWREVLALARPHLRSQWHALDGAQRARFLRHARSLWDVHRHRAPAGPLAAVHSLMRSGVLEVHAGRIESASPFEDGVEVFWRPRGASKSRAWLVDRVINCTGPDCRADSHADPFLRSLFANGFIRSDALSLGIEVAADGRTIGQDGSPVDSLYYVGPWLRARDWEATAVPELREHAARLAEELNERTSIEESSQSTTSL